MSFCRPPATVKSACAASHNPMLLRPHFSTGSASPYPSACASPITSCQHLLQAPDCQKCSDDFLAKVLICLDPTVDSAQVGLAAISGSPWQNPTQVADNAIRRQLRIFVGRPGAVHPDAIEAKGLGAGD